MRLLLTLVLTATLSATASAATGLITLKSAHPVAETIDRLATDVKAKGLVVIARVDHAAAAAKAGQALRPTELLIFGNPRAGTPLMRCDQTVGIDLPLKALAWQDAAGQVWLAANDPHYLQARHDLGSACDQPIAGIDAALRGFLGAAAAP